MDCRYFGPRGRGCTQRCVQLVPCEPCRDSYGHTYRPTSLQRSSAFNGCLRVVNSARNLTSELLRPPLPPHPPLPFIQCWAGRGRSGRTKIHLNIVVGEGGTRAMGQNKSEVKFLAGRIDFWELVRARSLQGSSLRLVASPASIGLDRLVLYRSLSCGL